jgi:hypothetical protein
MQGPMSNIKCSATNSYSANNFSQLALMYLQFYFILFINTVNTQETRASQLSAQSGYLLLSLIFLVLENVSFKFGLLMKLR